MAPITFTLDLEASPTDDHEPRRFRDVSTSILGALAERGVTGTVFIVGELAEAERELVLDVASYGHEIALHGYRHVPLPTLEETTFADDVRRGKGALEDLVGREVTGFRAPFFSLVESTPWVPDALTAAGFTYSSSVLPASSPLYGFPGCPRVPFRWPSGLLELPVPVLALGRTGLPFLGGVYLRLLPLPVVRTAVGRAGSQMLWTYCHPYDFDPDEPFRVLPHLGWAKSRLLWANRRNMLGKVGRVLGGGCGEPLGVRAARGDFVATEYAPR
jgi:polysaccharide deacetylase family protein (PEP-CTERM system associated)